MKRLICAMMAALLVAAPMLAADASVARAGPPQRKALPAPTGLAALDRLTPGSYEIRPRDAGEPGRRICAKDQRALLQIRHAGLTCKRFVIADRPDEVIVSYSCPGKGHGRTTIRPETSDLAQVMTQGIEDNAPFSIEAEVRRAGTCP